MLVEIGWGELTQKRGMSGVDIHFGKVAEHSPSKTGKTRIQSYLHVSCSMLASSQKLNVTMSLLLLVSHYQMLTIT